MQSMHSHLLRVAVVGFSVCLTVTHVRAATVWDEAVNGDLSGNGNSPTSLNLLAGENLVIATMPGSDLDFLTINIPVEHELSGLTMVSYTSTDGTSFIGMKNGTTIAVTGNPATLNGYAHFGTGPGNVGENILPEIGMGAGSIGFTPPLPSGSYSFWIQQANSVGVSYSFDFVVSALPPAGLLGDYNENDELDAADYTVWRDTVTAGGTTLANDPTPGTVDESDFEYWRDNFGDVLGSGAGSASAVPEPSGVLLACCAAFGLLLSRGLTRWQLSVKC